MASLSVTLTQVIQHHILSTPPPSKTLEEDIFVSKFVIPRGFTLSLAHQSLLLEAPLNDVMSWIWKGKVDIKIKFLMWLLWHDRIPYRALLEIVQDLGCLRCKLVGKPALTLLGNVVRVRVYGRA